MQILDCTLRDGSYEVDFQFSAQQTSDLCARLEDVGFSLIEVGHGVGLGASKGGLGVAAATDEEYAKAAAKGIKKAKWGMFAIPGICEIDQLNMCADYGMDFVRIGTAVDTAEEALPFIKRAKSLGFMVCTNFMKSYAATPDEFAQVAELVVDNGADVVYIVDSAGGMMPHEIEEFTHAARHKNPQVKLGFHGHDNLGLGIANALKAEEMNFDIVDATLQGFGRSAGNTGIERFLCCLERCGKPTGIDPIAVMDLGEEFIQPLIRTKGQSSIDTTSGLALFHSSYFKTIKKFAINYRVDARRLIVAVCQVDKKNAPEALVEKLAKELADSEQRGEWKSTFGHISTNEQKHI